MTISVRAAGEEDARSIVGLLNPIIAQGVHSVMDHEVTLEDQIAFIRSFPERGVYHVAVRDGSGELVGMQDVLPIVPEAAFAHVGTISTFVALAFHGQGIGSRLTRATLRAARQRRFRKISATIRADNPRAVAFYLRQGFRVVGTAHKHALIGGRYVDEVLAERWLD